MKTIRQTAIEDVFGDREDLVGEVLTLARLHVEGKIPLHSLSMSLFDLVDEREIAILQEGPDGFDEYKVARESRIGA